MYWWFFSVEDVLWNRNWFKCRSVEIYEGTHSPVSLRQSRVVWSLEVNATKAELCKKVTDWTQRSCPSSKCIHSPVSLRQSRTVWSLEADAKSAESCEKATDETQPWWPSNVCMHWLQWFATFGFRIIHLAFSSNKALTMLFLGANIRQEEYI